MFDYIYISHYPKLIERKENLITQFNKQNIINYEFINGIDRDSLTNDIIDIYYENNINNFIRKGLYTDKNIYYSNYRKLSKPEIANYLTHLHIYNKIITETNYNNVLILEDDAILNVNFIEISKILTLPEDYDIIYITEGCNLHIPQNNIKDNQYFYKMNNYSSRTCNAYIVSRNFCNTIINNDEKFNHAIDWELTYLCAKYNLNVYWLEPPIVYEGSNIGLYNSTASR
jgi:GR25 family glycosyltransferase involved in LPS biosynthesis